MPGAFFLFAVKAAWHIISVCSVMPMAQPTIARRTWNTPWGIKFTKTLAITFYGRVHPK